MRIIKDYKIIIHGAMCSDYFQGCGTSCTEFDECYTGTGYSVKDALNDAVDNMCCDGWLCSGNLEQEIEEADGEEIEVCDEMYVFVSIRVK